MASPRRVVAYVAVTGVAVLVAAALVLFLGPRGSSGNPLGTAGAGINEAGANEAGQPAAGSSSVRPGTSPAAGQAGPL
jgi:hypothetical protein